MTDYKRAFFEPEKMKEVEERDYPKEIIDYKRSIKRSISEAISEALSEA
jgi:hypothetical protein